MGCVVDGEKPGVDSIDEGSMLEGTICYSCCSIAILYCSLLMVSTLGTMDSPLSIDSAALGPFKK